MLKLVNTQLETISSGQWPLGNYFFDADLIEKWNGQIVGHHWVSELNIDNFENHQTRARDYDKGHVQELKIQIISDGLHRSIIGEITNQGKVKILSGHHRTKALLEISRDKGEEFALFPITIVSFENDWDRSFWKQVENKHDAVKRHGKDDAIKFLVDLRNDGYKDWNIRSDDTRMKQEAYEALTSAGYPYQGAHKKEIYVKAFNGVIERDTIRSVSAAEADRDSTVLFNQEKDKWQNNKYVISSSLDASRKCLFIAQSDRSQSILDGKINALVDEPGSIKMLVYVPGAWKEKSKLTMQRKNYLNKIRTFNIVNAKSFNALVDEVVFPPQFRGKNKKETEVSHLKFAWDPSTKQFIEKN